MDLEPGKFLFLCLTFTEEHVPDTEDTGPRQRAGEDAHEPLGHVEDGVNLKLLQMAVSHGAHSSQQGEENLSVKLDCFLEEQKTKPFYIYSNYTKA